MQCLKKYIGYIPRFYLDPHTLTYFQDILARQYNVVEFYAVITKLLHEIRGHWKGLDYMATICPLLWMPRILAVITCTEMCALLYNLYLRWCLLEEKIILLQNDCFTVCQNGTVLNLLFPLIFSIQMPASCT